jgi:hypothetical protein
MNSSNRAVFKSKVLEVIQLTIGIFNLFIFGVGTLPYFINPALKDKRTELFVFIVLDILWIIIIMFGMKRKRIAERFKVYASILLVSDSFSISHLSTLSCEPEPMVLKNLNQMIKWKFFKNAFINYETNRIILSSEGKDTNSVHTGSSIEENNNIVRAYKNVDEKNKGNKVTSWPAVLILIVVFPPVGFILLIKKLYQDKEGAYINSIVARILASIMLAIGLMLWYTVITKDTSAYNIFVSTLFFLLPGSLLFIKGLNLKKDAEKYEKYLELLASNGVVFTDGIASEYSLPYEKLARESINTNGSNKVDGNRRKQNVNKQNTPAKSESKKKPSKVIICNSCGGKNVVSQGDVVECDYCKSPIIYS